MVEDHREAVAGEIVAAAGEQDRVRRLPAPDHAFDRANEILELSAVVRHAFDGVAAMRNRLDIPAEFVIEVAQDVVERVVEP